MYALKQLASFKYPSLRDHFVARQKLYKLSNAAVLFSDEVDTRWRQFPKSLRIQVLRQISTSIRLNAPETYCNNFCI